MTETESMVERVAKAACEAGYHQWPLTDGYNDRAEKRAWLKIARAAIEAMKEPTPAMLKAGEDSEYGDSYHYAAPRHVWPAMIVKALEE